jgi:hypothetical protein
MKKIFITILLIALVLGSYTFLKSHRTSPYSQHAVENMLRGASLPAGWSLSEMRSIPSEIRSAQLGPFGDWMEKVTGKPPYNDLIVLDFVDGSDTLEVSIYSSPTTSMTSSVTINPSPAASPEAETLKQAVNLAFPDLDCSIR